MERLQYRRQVLEAFGASDTVLEELLAYNAPAPFSLEAFRQCSWPLQDQASVTAWRDYYEDAARVGVASALCRPIPHLLFPIESGMGESGAYKKATRQGVLPTSRKGVTWRAPEKLELFLHQSPTGAIPVVVAGHREDFCTLVRAIGHRNEPVEVPASMGAIVYNGFNNWDRIRRIRDQWTLENAESARRGGWPQYFKTTIVPDKALYKDQFIILGRTPYSDVPAHVMGCSPEIWLERSLALRLAHECAHLVTKRVWGFMRINMHDELLADYYGLVQAMGEFKAEWFCRFVGLEEYPRYRSGGRMENYCGSPRLSEDAFKVECAVVYHAAHHAEAFFVRHRSELLAPGGLIRALAALSSLTLEEMACETGPDRLSAALPE